MNPSDGVPGGAILEYAVQGFTGRITGITIQDQVERSGSRAVIPSCPALGGVAPETPNFRSARGDLGPVMANE